MNTERNEYIYVLQDENELIFYVGRSVDAIQRLQQHLDESLSGTSKKCAHIRQLLGEGHTIQMKIIDQAPASKIMELEAWWIDRLWMSMDSRGRIIDLKNGNAGSQGNLINEVEVRNAIQQHKRNVKKPKKKPLKTVRQFDPVEYAELEKLYETDRPRFEQLYAVRRELNATRERCLNS